MSGPNEKHPKRWKWRIEWMFQTGLEKAVGWMPGPWVFRLGEMLGGWVWHLLPRRRHAVLRNLRIAFGDDHDLPTLRRMAKATFRRTAANLFSAAHTARLAPDQLGRVIQIENLALLEHTLAEGKGLVLLLSHMGNWEILSRIVHLFPKGSQAGAFYRPLNNPLLDSGVLRRRQVDGTRMFSKRDNPHVVVGFLREGGIVGILADQRVGPQGEMVRFFGRLTRASPLPSLLARRAKCPVLALSLTTLAPGKWSARFVPMGQKHSTADCMATLEQAMRDAHADVFWLQERWKVCINPYYPIQKWLGTQAHGSGRPHRALIWLTGAPPSWRLPDEWLHPDVIYEVVLESGQARPSWVPEATRVHSVPGGGSARCLRKVMEVIDLAAVLPVDFIVTCGPSKELSIASFRECIPLVPLPAPP